MSTWRNDGHLAEAETPKRRYLALEEKRRIVEETLVEGASVAQVARAHGRNANLVFNWLRLYQIGLLCRRGTAKLLPVKVMAESSPASSGGVGDSQSWSAGTIQIQLRNAHVRIEGRVDGGVVRVVLESLGQ